MASSSVFFRVRVGLLLATLVGVVVWARLDVLSRRDRNLWLRSLHVAVVLLRVDPLEPGAEEALKQRVGVLEDRLDSEMRRYLPSGPRPFYFTVTGPVDVAARPPQTQGDGLLALASAAWERRRYFASVDRQAGLDAGQFDSRVYVLVKPRARRELVHVEGESELGGRIGTAFVEVDHEWSSADFALSVVAHELLHTLDASDKLDDRGLTLVPAGLAEPEREPRYPQRFVEVMARNRPVAPGIEKPLETLDELAVGPATAREVGWLR